MRPWNVLATSLEGRRDALLISLRRLGAFRPGGYRNVIVGQVESVPAFLDRVREALTTDLLLPTALAKVIPVETILHFDASDPLAAIAPAGETFLERLATGSFFVRLERRGLKGRLHSPTMERELADHIWRGIEARGHAPRVDFRDPDAVLVVETLGDDAGLGLVTRAMREQYPFVKIR